jgi:hypothetical protein
MYFSKETRKDPSMTGRVRKEYAGRLLSLLNQYETESTTILNDKARPVQDYYTVRSGSFKQLQTIIGKYVRQGYLSGKVYGSMVLKQYRLINPAIAQTNPTAQLQQPQSLTTANEMNTIEDLTAASIIDIGSVFSAIPFEKQDGSTVAVLANKSFMSAFNRAVIDVGRSCGFENYEYVAAGTCEGCVDKDGQVFQLAPGQYKFRNRRTELKNGIQIQICEDFSLPPYHAGCSSIIIPTKADVSHDWEQEALDIEREVKGIPTLQIDKKSYYLITDDMAKELKKDFPDLDT